MSGASDIALPEGIEKRHIHEAGGSFRHQWPVGMLGLGVLLLASVLGWFGTEEQLTAAASEVQLSVDGPSRIRNGEFFELLITIETDRPIGDLTLVIDEDVWRDTTVNTFIPAASEENFEDGAFTFAFGPFEPGSQLSIKVDGQVNPDHTPSANRGPIAVADGDEPLVELDYVMEVLP